MAQIAQQTPLTLKDPGTLAGLQQATKNKLKEFIKRGTILDVILETTEGGNKINVSKVVGYQINTTSQKAPVWSLWFLNTDKGTLAKVDITLP